MKMLRKLLFLPVLLAAAGSLFAQTAIMQVASNINASTAVLRGQVNAGTIQTAGYYFTIGTDPNNLLALTPGTAPISATNIAVTYAVSNLLAGTRYYSNIVITNIGGRYSTPIETFVTTQVNYLYDGLGYQNIDFSRPYGTEPAFVWAQALVQFKQASRDQIAAGILSNQNNGFQVNVLNYGALCNGVNDDAAAIRAAIAAVGTNGGGRVYIPGNSRIGSPISITNNAVYLVGAGNGVSSIFTTNEIGNLVTFNNVTWGGAANMQFTFQGSNSTAGAGLVLYHSQLISVEHVRAYGLYGGVKLVSCLSVNLNDVKSAMVESWGALRVGSYGLALTEQTGLGGWDYNTGIQLINCGFGGNPTYPGWLNFGVLIQSVDGITIENTTAALSAIGWYVNPQANTSPLDLIQMSNCGADTCSNIGFQAYASSLYTGGSGGNIIRGMYFYNTPNHFQWNLPTSAPSFQMADSNFELSTTDSVQILAGYGIQLKGLVFTDVRNSNLCIHLENSISNSMVTAITYQRKNTEVCGGVVRLESGTISNIVYGIGNGGALTNVSDAGTANKVDRNSIQ